MKTNKLLLLVLMLILPLAVMAHAPKKVNVSYDTESSNLVVSVDHPVKDVNDHYIESLAISVNGENVITLDYTAQSSKESHDVEVEMADLNTGDKIEVKAVCNKLGSKSGELSVE